MKPDDISGDRPVDIIDELDTEVHQILKDDYIHSVRKLTGTEISCMKLSTILSSCGFIFTGMGSVLAFSSGYFGISYISFTAGCANVLAMILMKASQYANSQSHYHDAKLKNHLTKDYRFIHDFVRDPFSLKPVNEPSMPDPMNIMGHSSVSRCRLSPPSQVSPTPTSIDFWNNPELLNKTSYMPKRAKTHNKKHNKTTKDTTKANDEQIDPVDQEVSIERVEPIQFEPIQIEPISQETQSV